MPSITAPTAIPRATLGAALLFAIVVGAIYADTLTLGFQFDDAHVIEANPHIRRLRNIPRFFVDVETSSASQTNGALRPLLFITFALNYAVSGNAPWSYHLVNLLLHWIVTCLVYRIVRDHFWLAGAATPIAIVAALVVAAHPLNTSAVTYVSARSALLVTALYLGAFDAAVRRRFAVSLCLFIGALLSKEIAVTFPLVLAAYWAIARSRGETIPPWKFFAVVIAATGAGLLYRAALMPTGLVDATHDPEITPLRYAMTGWSAYLYYLRQFLWPNALVIDRLDYRVVRAFGDTQAWGSLATLAGLGVGAWRVRRRYPAVTMAALWFAVTLAAESTIFPLAEPVNEHRPYLAMLGLGTATAVGLWEIARAGARRFGAPPRWTLAVGATFVITALGATAVGRNQTWHDDFTLWVDATAKAPGNPRAWSNAGRALLTRGRYAEARTFLEESRRLAPCYSYALMNLSVLAWKTDDLRASLVAAEDAVRCNPRLALAHHYRGAALERLGRSDDALRAYRQTTAIDGQQLEAWFAEGNLLAQRGDWVGAVAAYDQGLAVDPARPEMAMAAGLIYHHRLADTRRALVRYEQVLQAAPAHYGARYQRAVALLAAGEDARAVEAWRAFVPLAVAAGDDAALDGAPERLRRAAPPRPAGTRPST